MSKCKAVMESQKISTITVKKPQAQKPKSENPKG